MVDQELVNTLVQTVIIAGAPGSAGYNQALAQLQADAAAVRAKLSASDGKQLVGVIAGESATWTAGMALQDLLGAYTQALMRLQGMAPIVRRTSARFLE
jgi:hypothetical protein